MSLYGHGAVTIWHDLLPQAKDNFYAWHNHEHMPERVGIPGFRRGRRYIAERGVPEYFNLYEADSPEVLSGQDYLNRLNAPTPWTREVVVSFRNVTRAICRVVFSGGVGQGGHMLTLRFDLLGANAWGSDGHRCVAAHQAQSLLCGFQQQGHTVLALRLHRAFTLRVPMSHLSLQRQRQLNGHVVGVALATLHLAEQDPPSAVFHDLQIQHMLADIQRQPPLPCHWVCQFGQ